MIKPEVKPEIKEEPKPAASADIKPMKVTFTKEELKAALEPPLQKIYSLEPEASPFREPVNPELLGIPDYFEVVKDPMDLSTIKKKLDDGEYKDPWEFIDDVWLMFDNAWVYNRKTSRVYKYCNKVSREKNMALFRAHLNNSQFNHSWPRFSRPTSTL